MSKVYPVLIKLLLFFRLMKRLPLHLTWMKK